LRRSLGCGLGRYRRNRAGAAAVAERRAVLLCHSLVAGTLGPTSVALVTDHVFGESGIRYSMATVAGVGMTLALVLFAAGLGSYRRTLAERDVWSVQHAA